MSLKIPEERRRLFLHILNGVLVLCGLCALGLFTFLVGWLVPTDRHSLIENATRWILGIFVIQEIFRVALQKHPLSYVLSHKVETIIAFLIALELCIGGMLYEWLEIRNGFDVSAETFTLFYLAGSQLTLFVLVGLRGLRDNRLLSHRYLTPGLVFMLSLALLATLGTLLLMTPRATPEGGGVRWLDAVFTATSAICVTGLNTVDISTGFTRHGQWVILFLIQLGGLGVMTFTYFLAYFLAGGVSLRNRIALQDLLSKDTLGQIGTVLGVIIGFTFTCEAIGAAAIYSLLGAHPGGIAADDRLFFSIFHSVSAFCSAGFSTLSGGFSNDVLKNQDGVLAVVLTLVVAGAIGFPVMQNCWQVLVGKVRKALGLRNRHHALPRLSTNTKLVLTTTLVLFVFGTLAVYVTEFLLGQGRGSGGGALHSLFIAMFDAVGGRTAGFTTATNELFSPATAIVIMFLMFVGGGPSSTAGGIKTATLAVAVLSLRRVLFGRSDIEAFGRRLDDSTAHRALATIFVAIGFITLIAITLCLLEPNMPAVNLGFEAISAVSTAGLSRDVTAHLSDASKLVLVFAMFCGRVGVLTCLMAFIPRRDAPAFRLPEDNIILN
ncbi:MAG: hypothetical protein LBV54_04630 [Puniceicoccales bacterium]|jgi:Trk-type K+ transport system membrane component|nr:hypothetical protein [Puniceicoccales bacterium]